MLLLPICLLTILDFGILCQLEDFGILCQLTFHTSKVNFFFLLHTGLLTTLERNVAHV